MRSEVLSSISVFIADDHELTRQGLRYAFRDHKSVEIIGEAGEGTDIVNQVCAEQPDVVLMDIVLDGMDGIEATRQIKRQRPEIRVVMLTSHDSDDRIFSAFSAGADAYCLKTISGDMLVQAVQSVHEGVGWLDPGIAKRVLRACVQSVAQPAVHARPAADCASKNAASPFPLSERELAVLRLVVNGLSNQEIGEQLFLSPETIKSHLRKIFDKLLVADRTQAAVKAIRDGLV
ncbi:MAG TPA: response regulator transcription factor [Oculatellaceae cyanobacterium]